MFAIKAAIAKIEAKDKSVLHLYRVGDGHFQAPSLPSLHEILIVHDWDKNGVYYNLHKGNFPHLETIVMMSHPCMDVWKSRYPNATWIHLKPGHRFLTEHTVSKSLKPVAWQMR